MIGQALTLLISIQNTANRKYFQEGLFPSERRYKLFRLKRPDDNVYFTSYILHILKENRCIWEKTNLHQEINQLISKAEQALLVYQHGQDGISFNYYQTDGFFPNGLVFNKFIHFKPANDADDSSVAFLGLDFSTEKAKALQEKFAYHANGIRNRWVKRVPKTYQSFRTYNTWLGTDKLYVDLDFGVLCNILQFVAKYELEISSYEQEAVKFIEQAILSGDYLKQASSISAWYPDHAVILYFFSRVVKTKYYTFSHRVLEKVIQDIKKIEDLNTQATQRILLEIALSNLDVPISKLNISLNEVLEQDDFSIGVVPMAQPWNHQFAQKVGSLSIFRMTYHCPAHQIALWLERAFIDAKVNHQVL